MPIYFADYQQPVVIKSITGTDKIREHLKSLGFVVGESVKLVANIDNNIIVKLKGVSLAIGMDLAKRILI